ncbi:hypothetical protein B0H14DRAFT_3165148 [Mycena olivaceomarginata]|nr:hypothetical protein B0H14DRAFT_3165148 [Mycena olivaceomarginata]
MFPPKISRDRHFARAIERDKTDTLKVLDDYLWKLLANNPELSDVCMRMGELVHRGLLSVTTGFTLTDEQYEHPLKWMAPDIPMSLLAARPGKAKGRKQKQVIDLVPTLETLLPSKPEFGAAAIIIREALSRKREHPATDDTRIFRRMLDALHPTQQKRTQYDPDQHNPIRADLRSFALLQDLLPLKALTTAYGTLQSPDACVALFSEVENLNNNRSPATRIKLDCPNVYGQANTWYSCRPRYAAANGVIVELSLKQKFEPYFCVEIQQRWEAFLGPLANRDPVGFSEEEKLSWEDTMGWVINSGLRGFGPGLGALQFTNTLFLAGIVRSPSVLEMAQWIAVNQDYGAFTGLKVLGFNLHQNSSAAAIRAAFMCFYHWLDHFMTQKDKDTVSFGTVFVEQLLCKIRRWQHRLMHMAQ